MTIPRPNPKIRPYLNPAYWEGHSLGFGEAPMISPDASYASKPEQFRALGTLLAHQQQLVKGYVALEGFKDGDKLNPNDHAPGTLFCLEQEALAKSCGAPNPALGDSWPKLPVRPRMHETRSIRDDSLEGGYVASTVWGVVTRKRRFNRLGQRLLLAVTEPRSGKLYVGDETLGHVTMGETVHTRVDCCKTDKPSESLCRYTHVERVSNEGSSDGKRVPWLLGLLGQRRTA